LTTVLGIIQDDDFPIKIEVLIQYGKSLADSYSGTVKHPYQRWDNNHDAFSMMLLHDQVITNIEDSSHLIMRKDGGRIIGKTFSWPSGNIAFVAQQAHITAEVRHGTILLIKGAGFIAGSDGRPVLYIPGADKKFLLGSLCEEFIKFQQHPLKLCCLIAL
jgi:hypothetical protein